MKDCRVCVVVPTFQRPERLANLLAGLERQEFKEGAFAFDVFVLDNDVNGSSSRVALDSALDVGYQVVPIRGLSVIRNVALDLARSYDYLAMMDDDQLPANEWLNELLRVAEATRADAVIGPVVPLFEVEPVNWISTGRFFSPVVYANSDAAFIKDGNSGNCLIRMATVMELNLRFNLELNFAGGEDQFFFRSLAARGGKIAFANRALATEVVPLQRQKFSWLATREFRSGGSLAYCDRHIRASIGKSAFRVLKASMLIGVGVLALMPRSLLYGLGGFFASILQIIRGAGMLAGMLGWQIEPYAGSRRQLRLS